MRARALVAVAAGLAVLASSGCKQPTGVEIPQARPSLAGTRLLVVMPTKDYDRRIYDAVARALDEAGASYEVCSSKKGEAVSTRGGKVEVTVAPDVDPEPYAAIVFVGEPGVRALMYDPDLVSLVKGFYAAGKVVAAIHTSAGILGEADLLRGRTVTAGSEIKAELEAKGATVTSKPVEVDGQIITAHGPEAAEQFAQTVVRALSRQRPTSRP